MVLSNVQQSTVLLLSLLFGVGLGAYYDLFRIFRLFVPCSAVAIFFQDFAYFISAAVASFLFIFEVNDGTVRLFILAAFFFGGVAFRLTVGRCFLRICSGAKKYFSERKFRRIRKTQQTKQPKAEG